MNFDLDVIFLSRMEMCIYILCSALPELGQ